MVARIPLRTLGHDGSRPASCCHAMVSIEAISSGLQKGEDGIWYGTRTAGLSYPAEGYDNCLAIEDSSFWFRHRNDCILAAVNSHPPPWNGPIFDVGGGNGFVTQALARAGFEVVLVEPGRAGAENAKRRGVEPVICSTLEGAGFAPCTLPACGLFDVLEHVSDDVSFLASIRDLIVPGGSLYVTVPAYRFLWSEADEQAGHFRRYTLKTLSAAVQQAGLKPEFSTYFFRWLPVVILLARSLPHRLGFAGRTTTLKTARREHMVSSSGVSGAQVPLLGSELRNIRRRRPMRFGGSCLMVARRS